jgi:hypothetical protein
MDPLSVYDYSKYSADELLDIYVNMDKDSNPEAAAALQDELKRKSNTAGLKPSSSSGVKNLFKKWYGKTAIVILIVFSFFAPRLIQYEPGQPPSPGMVLIPMVIQISIISLLVLLLFRQKIYAAILIVLYFLYIMFGRMIF